MFQAIGNGSAQASSNKTPMPAYGKRRMPDSMLQTSAEGIYAAGDVCSYDSVVHGRRLRVEHWDVAMQQGMHVGRCMAGDSAPYEVVPYFFSDLADWASLEYVGPASEWDEEIWRGDRDAGEFAVFYLKGGKVAGCLSVGRSAEREGEDAIREEIKDTPGIEKLFRAITMQFGPQVMLAAKVQMRPGLSIEEAVARINDLETRIHQRFPEIAWCFIEPDDKD